jgi:hypothetical protein
MSNIPSHPDLAQYSFVCDELNGMTLECFFEYEEEEIGSIEPMSGLKLEPDYPELWNLLHVYLPDGLDIGGILHESILADIQDQAVTQFMLEAAEAYAESRLP